jgi:2-keto-4-pentenoate hydratase
MCHALGKRGPIVQPARRCFNPTLEPSRSLMSFSAHTAAAFVADAHRKRETYKNLPIAIAPSTLDEAYAVQEALADLWRDKRGPVEGLKIATTTKVMQALMGIDHPCGGLIFRKDIHASGWTLTTANFMHVVIECELAVRINCDLPIAAAPYDRSSIRSAIGAIMPAFELIEDRNAVYRETNALSLISDNSWNGGIVLGADMPLPLDLDLNGLTGTLVSNTAPPRQGITDDPLGALAWVANLASSRGRPLRAGMVVITGSLIPTLPIPAGDHFRFTIDGLGTVELQAPMD